MPNISSRPWGEAPAQVLRSVVGILTDIDDTLTTDGAITRDALDALASLRVAGLHVVAVTGRPMGWSRPFASDWPVDAIVAENGAVMLFRRSGELLVEYVQDEATRAINASRLQIAAERVLCEVPGSVLAQDSAGRMTDIAIDHSEHVRLSSDQIERVVSVMRAKGMNATVSSIHINGWFGEHDKYSGARWALRRLFSRDLEGERDRWVYVGDSTNDQAMFGRFPMSVGVANLMDFAEVLAVWPAFITRLPRGGGFAEVASRVIGARAV